MLSAKIFGDVPRPLDLRSHKTINLFKKQPRGNLTANYYPPLKKYNSLLMKMRTMGLYHDEYLDFKDEVVAKRKMEGKTKTKKGQGKKKKK